jgi:hypothetical protein
MTQPQVHTVTVEVFSPKEVDPKTFTWSITMKVEDAAKEAATAFGYGPGNPTFKLGNEILNRNKTLQGAHVKDGDKLELVDVGGGV